MSHHDVIVVGTGLAGLTAAVRAAESGARVLRAGQGHRRDASRARARSTCSATRPSGSTRRSRRCRRTWPSARAIRTPHVGVEGITAALDWLKEHVPVQRLARGQPADPDRRRRAAAVGRRAGDDGARRPARAAARSRSSASARSRTSIRRCAPTACGGRRSRRARSCSTSTPEGRADVNELGYARALDDAGVPRARAGPARAAAARGRARGVPRRARDHVAARGLRGPRRRGSAGRCSRSRRCRRRCPGCGSSASSPTALQARPRRGAAEQHRGRGGRRGRPRARRCACGSVCARSGSAPTGWCSPRAGSASGGIELDSHWAVRETALGLPVAGVPGRGEPRFDADYFARAPVQRGGRGRRRRAAPGRRRRPADLRERAGAGATLGGCEPWKEKSGDGISLSTGYAAAGIVLGATTVAGATS